MHFLRDNPATRHPRWACTLIMFTALLVPAMLARHRPMYYDAGDYWTLGQQFAPHGHFSLRAYADALQHALDGTGRLRGYVPSLALFVIQQAASAIHIDARLLFQICSAALGAILAGSALPTLFQRLTGIRLTLISVGTFCVLVFAFWRGHFLYSLTDFPALLLVTAGLLCLDQYASIERRRVLVSLCAGVCLALAVNTRPVYLPTLIGAGLFIAWRGLASDQRWRGTAICVLTFAVGVVGVLVPQMVINQTTFHSRSPFAQNRPDPGQPSLYLQQLGWGIAIQRYETSVVHGAYQMPDSVVFLDPRGEHILGVRHQVEDPRVFLERHPLGYGSYARLVATHPVFFASMYARHVFNGLDVAYPTPYVSQIVPRNRIFALINYLVLIAAILGLAGAWGRIRIRRHATQLALLAMLLLPALITIPTAIEPRFFLPIWVCVYGLVAFSPVIPRLLRRLLCEWYNVVGYVAVSLVLMVVLDQMVPTRIQSGLLLMVSMAGLAVFTRASRRGASLARGRRWISAVGFAAALILCFSLAGSTFSNILAVPDGYPVWCLTDCSVRPATPPA